MVGGLGGGGGHSTCEMLVPSVPTRNSKQDRHHQGQYMYYYEGGSGQPASATCTRPLPLAPSAVVGNKSPKDRVVHHLWPSATKTAAADIRIIATRHSSQPHKGLAAVKMYIFVEWLRARAQSHATCRALPRQHARKG